MPCSFFLAFFSPSWLTALLCDDTKLCLSSLMTASFLLKPLKNAIELPFSTKSASLYYCWCISIFLCVRQSANKESNKEYKSHWCLKLCTLWYIVQLPQDFHGCFCLTKESSLKSRNLLAELFFLWHIWERKSPWLERWFLKDHHHKLLY